MAKSTNKTKNNWYAMDLHLHTPASSDYQQPDSGYLEILKQAEARRLDMIAFTDHNTVAGYRKMQEEIEQLSLLKSLNRIMPEEQYRLDEYIRLLDKIMVLPGFEFTATFGFHILGIFPPDKNVREIEHILLSLNIPPDQIDDGSVTVGASSDVLVAYKAIADAGGLVIAAHANSTNGVAMRGFPFGGQTKIAFTQDVNLHALEVTDLEARGRHATQYFFRGTKPEYPRRMHCIQGSDAHTVTKEKSKKKTLGVGDRVTEVLLQEKSFKNLFDLFANNDFSRTRPRHGKVNEPEQDFVNLAREEGSNIVQDFHEQMTIRGGKLYAIIADVCAFGNTNGGSLYVGLDNNKSNQVVGVNNPNQALKQLEKEISSRISPPLNCTVDAIKTGGKSVLRILVPRGEDPPYAVDDNKIYVREEAETGLAVRDEIVQLVKRRNNLKGAAETHPVSMVNPPTAPQTKLETESETDPQQAPRTGVEVVSVSERNNQKYFTVRDLRNGNVVKTLL